jgi:hypothetical protein
MEPLTAIAVIATKYGVAELIGALTGERSLGELAVELVGALAESENRLAERLAGIEQRLDEVLEQPYSIAIGTGLRTLLDAGRATDTRVRNDELDRARDQFRTAAASARTALQLAVAERYLALCAIGLGRDDAARTALEQLNVAAFDAALDASKSAGLRARVQARARLEGAGWFRREERITELANAVNEAAAQAGQLAGYLLREASVLAEGLGDGPRPRLRRLPATSKPLLLALDQSVERWEVRPRGSQSARFGPISVTWHSVRRRPETATPDPRTLAEQRILPPLALVPRPTAHMFDVDLTVRADPVLSRPVSLSFTTTPVDVPLALLAGGSLPAGERELRIQRAVSASKEPTLNVGDVLLFRPETS